MSRLDELIRELCPDGVKYRRIGEIAQCQKGRNKKHITENAYSITQRGLIPTKEYFGEKTQITSADTSNYYLVYKNWFVYSPSRIDVGSISYLKEEGPVLVSPIDVVFSIDMSAILPKYLLSFLLSGNGMFQILSLRQGIEGTGRKSLPFSEFEKIRIPVPPIEVQREIVRILDKFTTLTAELTAELTARQRQYEYYREKLFLFDEMFQGVCPEDVPFECIGSLAECLAGATPKTTKSENWIDGDIPWMSSGEVNKKQIFDTDTKITQKGYDSCSTKMVPANTVVVALAGQGKTRGTVAITRIKLCTNQSLCSIIVGERLLPDFLYYYLCGQYQKLREISSGDGTRGGLNLKMIRDFVVPVPPIKVQHDIVRILKRFDAICNDLTSGLPAEIEARKKQYEYYRDKLLTFEHYK